MATYRVRNNIFNDAPDELKVPLKFDITMLNMFIGYIFKDKAANITRKSLSMVSKLFKIIDRDIYANEPQMDARIEVIMKGLEAKLENGLSTYETVINYCRTDMYDEYNENILRSVPTYMKISYDEIKFINKVVEDRLRYYYVLIYKDRMYNVMEKLDSGDFKSFEEINSEFQSMCTSFINKSRSARTINGHDEFKLSDENFDNNIKDIVERIRNPKNVLRTGIQKLNEILSPGYLGGRTYIYLGTPGGFKSGLLLKTVRDIKMYNKGITGENPEKRPTVLLVTMENSVEETVERWFNMSASNEDIRSYTPSQVVKILKECGEFSTRDAADIDVIIKYFPNRSITTDDLYTTIDDLNDSGSDVIALVFDYIKRIRPAEKGKDEKEELKNITNELKSLAQHFDIPVITAHQLNREAALTVDNAMQANKADLARMLGRGNVGSAWEIIENADFVCILNLEKKQSTGQYYLTFKRVKIRYKNITDSGYFNHPFNADNRMRLIDDIGMPESISEDSLASDFVGVDINNSKGKKNAKPREENNILSDFEFGTMINTKK